MVKSKTQNYADEQVKSEQERQVRALCVCVFFSSGIDKFKKSLQEDSLASSYES